jgi:hypothetical protein
MSKVMLVKQGRIGCYVAFAAAVTVNPEQNDFSLLLSVNMKKLSKVNAQYKMTDAISALNDKMSLGANDRKELLDWALKMPNIPK